MASSAGVSAASAASMPAATFFVAVFRLVRCDGLTVGCFLVTGFAAGLALDVAGLASVCAAARPEALNKTVARVQAMEVLKFFPLTLK